MRLIRNYNQSTAILDREKPNRGISDEENHVPRGSNS